ncbi:MAG: peptidase MA family metallohydrolase [Desulfatiglandales bacterium]
MKSASADFMKGRCVKSAWAVFIPLLLFLSVVFAHPLPIYSRTLQVFERQDVRVMVDASFKGAVEEVFDLYPGVKADLEAGLGLEVDFTPSVLLINDTRTFREMAGGDFVVAFAVPKENLMVIDYSRATLNPFSLRVIVKHELCHLLLHHYLEGHRIPRWFEEGIAQWSSEGIGEMLMDSKKPRLNEAVLAGKIIPLREISDFFPADRESLSLAYEQSLSFVSYLVDRCGLEGILQVLEAVRKGYTWEEAVRGAMGASSLDLEAGWRSHLKKRLTWFTYLVNNLYQILFFLAAVASIIGFVRAYLRKRAYLREMEE